MPGIRAVLDLFLNVMSYTFKIWFFSTSASVPVKFSATGTPRHERCPARSGCAGSNGGAIGRFRAMSAAGCMMDFSFPALPGKSQAMRISWESPEMVHPPPGQQDVEKRA